MFSSTIFHSHTLDNSNLKSTWLPTMSKRMVVEASIYSRKYIVPKNCWKSIKKRTTMCQNRQENHIIILLFAVLLSRLRVVVVVEILIRM